MEVVDNILQLWWDWMYIPLLLLSLNLSLCHLRQVYCSPSRLPPFRMFPEPLYLYVSHPGPQANIVYCLQVILRDLFSQGIALIRSQDSSLVYQDRLILYHVKIIKLQDNYLFSLGDLLHPEGTCSKTLQF